MLLRRIKEFIYRVPFLVSCYHYLAALAGAVLYGFPSRKIFVIGVTGTKGKTTVVELMNAILTAAGKKIALLSSVAVVVGGERRENTSETTMPGRFFIERFLRQAVRAQCEYALVEVTSQGVTQHRHRFIKWRRAFLINIHPEHIEAHGSFEKYRAAKLSFLRYAARQGAAIFLNSGDQEAHFFEHALRGRNLVFYSRRDADSLESPGLFPSDFNRDNVAAAVALARNLGISEEAIREGLRAFRGVPGRMEFVQKEPFAVVIDYAHTPQSLELVFQTLKSKIKSQKSKLVCVFGSAGGGRDKWKRPKMGEIAGRYCDRIVLTTEDPYDEDPASIMRAIERGIPRHNLKEREVYSVPDRGAAIREAIGMAGKGDIVAITGKGSEEWIHVAAGKRIPWSDRKVVEEILSSQK